MAQIIAAGVLPLSIDPAGQIVVLLGQEHYQYDWVDQGTWSGFGGHLEPGETIEKGAAREFEEESMALWADQATILQIIKFNQDGRLITTYTNGRYQEFVIYFNYSEEIPTQFERVYNYIHRCAVPHPYKRPMFYVPSCPGGYSEKIKVKWVQLIDLENNQVAHLRPCFAAMIGSASQFIRQGLTHLTHLTKI